MNASQKVSLAEQRLNLRRKLAEQRARIAQHLASSGDDAETYPRSKTMRFLIRHSGSAFGILADVAGFPGVVRLPRMLTSILLGVRVLCSLRGNNPRN
jgi:RNA:NAD 2'-phosphotransferase (TPT1/KptA family)